MAAGLGLTALIAIVAIIIGEWNDAITRSIGLTFSGWVHALVALGLLNLVERAKQNPITTYTLFGVTIASFITTVFNIFDIIPRSDSAVITFSLYAWYLGAIIAGVIIDALLHAAKKRDTLTRASVYTAVTSLAAFVLLSLLLVFNMYLHLPDLYGRILLVLAIVFSTSCVLSVVFSHLYRIKHPEAIAKPALTSTEAAIAKHQALPGWAIALIIIGATITFGPLILGVLGFLVALTI
jgi:magnesium-transporting ATPase (P-type)